MMGVKLHPHAASFPFRERAAYFNDSLIELSSVAGNSVGDLYQRIGNTNDVGSGFALIENFLQTSAANRKTQQFERLDAAVKRIAADKGQTSFAKLAAELAVTNRCLEKLFSAHIGVSPKLFAQIVRLQYSLQLLANGGDLSLTEIPIAGGFADQSHFIRSVKRFAGVTPLQLKNEKLQIQAPFLGSL